jgi:DNA modification methylase
MINWTLGVYPIKALKANEKNPRQISKEQFNQLQVSIEKFGFIDRPIINKDLQIICGHQRIKVLKRQKAKTVECWVPDRVLEESEVDELMVRHNLNTGAFDFDVLANEFSALDLLDWGFTESQLMGISKEDLENDILSDDEESELPEPCKDEDAITKLGDLYELGEHRIICGDSTSKDVVNRVMRENKPNIMVTDPPYGVNYDPNWRSKRGKAQKANGLVQNDHQCEWSLAYSLFPGSIVYVWCASLFCDKVAKNLEELGFERKSMIIWAKQNFSLSRCDYHWKHEICWYAIKKGCGHSWKSDRKQTTIWEIQTVGGFGSSTKEDEKTNHSTQKPLECMSRPIKHHTDSGEWVYDPFLGSGTTLIASEQFRRKCIGIELSPAFCDIIVKRYISFLSKKGLNAIIKRNGVIISNDEFI